jgi:hypothetical protein
MTRGAPRGMKMVAMPAERKSLRIEYRHMGWPRGR